MTTATQHRTRQHVSHPAFRADEQLAANLQQVLVDLNDLALQGKQAHWNAVGANFRDLHLQLDEIVAAARTFTDDVAERMRALYVVPDGTSARTAAQSSLPAFPRGEVDTGEAIDAIVASLYAVTGTVRRVHDEVDAADPTSADLLHTILERLEQLAWLTDAERRLPGASVPEAIVV
ncbi:DNA starvation/stationary phase protection protein [Nocardioides ginsengisoli]|uniref:Dps family protein n=1 Tax=Nocardioides ginsengisoli TaxID=363868 RepID=A0ABW3W5G2_9ACTN